jgi:hypothetical protein
MKARDVDFKKGMKVKLYIKSPYGSEFDEIKKYTVIGVRNYKRGQKIKLYDEDYNYECGIWKDEFPHEIEVV